MKLALVSAACCALGALASVPGRDAAVLLQSDLQVQARRLETSKDADRLLKGGAEEQAELARAALTRSVEVALAKESRRWLEVLLANGTRAALPAVLGEAGCSATDRQIAEQRGKVLADEVQKNVKAKLPQIMAGKQVDIKDVVTLPPACTVQLTPDSAWPALEQCTQQLLGVPAACFECAPQFAKQTRASCEQVCPTAITEFIKAVLEHITVWGVGIIGDAIGRKQMPPQEDMKMIVALALGTLSDGSTKKLVPCVECMAPPHIAFMGCLGGPSASSKAYNLAKQMAVTLSHGNVMGELMKLA